MSYGIDYGMGLTNVGADGIRFGVIPINSLTEWAWESLESEYAKGCPECGGDVIDYDSEKDGECADYDEEPEEGQYKLAHSWSCSDYMCESCRLVLGSDEVCGDEPIGHTLDEDGIKGESSDGIDLFVTSSPYYTHAQFCSPCAPGACYLLSPTDKQGPKCFCLDHSWFEGGKAPYPVFRVSDGTLVHPKRKKA